ncbi:MAG TPA: tRNA (adenosine(37)-N6)-threonylcarbamoyltransferase complex transferase subunit TsaD [Leptospiraceae bacterium]|nr:tRNA (adenosine(37)-N6)-threonylcarbamoyltransferase complex transferase subunit TsaD [Leptospiraceae bacterium]HMW07236.1 tRNA (adenosine(37)-N6)-threonylcarbamoyltransferase complex transferase subunit TsaD [Leptospiraceae bacterium]HMX35388.1 tRNA (adenosine(37)-N6)-threonylcarbamoyltransferase complex transferase subunit TsaD [Leptospiraceae bacterium]HMY32614.1 tRNA (adenosine(37)-N6)-threonylcarbamoyltransferase complex transferase subunit TsaD [Leptospiraceae bacterium]HMZ63759.1 tRNA
MFGIGIETSCDETSIGIVEDGSNLISLKIFSQIETHAEFRGVVPEIASRAHLEKINILLEEAIAESKIDWKDLSYVAVTNRPGLLGSLMIGAQLARSISLVHKIPIVPVDHLEAHLNTVQLEKKVPKFPYLGVLLSGGNSSILLVEDYGKMKLIADTSDDALGEAFDKVSSLLGLPYPGGPAVEKRANQHKPQENEKNPFPELLKDYPQERIEFSYSGLKTSVLYYLKKNTIDENKINEVCYHFQNTAFQLVEKNILKAVKATRVKQVVASGGVLANETLRKKLTSLAEKKKLELFYPEKKILCTDNGAMIASLGYYLFKQGKIDSIDFKVSPSR